MIAYFDTSAIVHLIINEASTDLCNRVWNESSRVRAERKPRYAVASLEW